MLKDFLDKFDQVGVISFKKNIHGENILMQQSICDNVERIFNGKFIEMNCKDDKQKSTNVLLRNDPSEIATLKINDNEESISVFYDDQIVNITGYKKSSI